MICIRCQMVVKSKLEKLGLQYSYVKIGEAEIIGDMHPEVQEQLELELKEAGLYLIDNKRTILVERIKNMIIELVHFRDEELKVNLSDYLSDKLNYNYTYLSNVFSEENNLSIERFYLAHKIEKVKEMIIYDEFNISEIAWKTNYSSVAHLSNQFKKYTVLTPTQFKRLNSKQRDTLLQYPMLLLPSHWQMPMCYPLIESTQLQKIMSFSFFTHFIKLILH